MLQLKDVVMIGTEQCVVVMINDCRAKVVPLNNRKMNDETAEFDETEQGYNLSPNALCDVIGRIRGKLIKRPTVLVKPRVDLGVVEIPIRSLMPPEKRKRRRPVADVVSDGANPNDDDVLNDLKTAAELTSTLLDRGYEPASQSGQQSPLVTPPPASQDTATTT